MEVVAERCCGLDVHQASVVACLLTSGPGRKTQREIRTFGTMKAHLGELRDWLVAAGCTQVAMESTGVYWMPVYVALEGHFTLVVGNATHIRNVPGRKTDVKDCQWLAELARHGLIRPSFVPPPPFRELRDLLRYRRTVVNSRTAERNRLLRELETANIKLASVLSDVFGVSGQLMLRAMLEGRPIEETAALAKGQLRKKKAQIELALDGNLAPHHRFILGLQLERLEHIAATLAKVDAAIKDKLTPYQDVVDRLMQIPGVDFVGAAVLVAELGVDMTVFQTAAHAAAWAGVCPGNNESAGKRKAQPSRRGNVHLKTALVQCAVAAAKTRDCYYREKFWRLRARRGPKRAAMAIAHKILVAAYHIIKTGGTYRELGANYLDHTAANAQKRSAIKRLKALGYEVQLTAAQKAGG